MLKIIKVRGQSMAPTLQDGDYVLTKSASTYDMGRIYLIDHSDLGLIIKRLEREAPDGRLIFAGDNPVSNSGNILGTIEKARVRTRAFLKISRKGIKRL